MNQTNRTIEEKLGEALENRIRALKKGKARWIGIVFLIVSLSCYLFTFSRSYAGGPMFVEFWSSHELNLTVALLQFLAFAALVMPGLPDRFQFATLFVLTDIPLFFASMIQSEAYLKTLPNFFVIFSIMPMFMLFFSWILLGVEAERTPAILPFFKSIGKFNAAIQKSYDSGEWRSPLGARWSAWPLQTKLFIISLAVLIPVVILIIAIAFFYHE